MNEWVQLATGRKRLAGRFNLVVDYADLMVAVEALLLDRLRFTVRLLGYCTLHH